ncbi:EamA family transporter [Paenibacillus sp. A3]|uniref:EamA family transporter n=1 Tax=Paenibacillus sp. A3 TaxID=1337054 RepID=UPI0012F9D473|nr:EamA family transporter [Paenibacillus sp. A3]
MNIKSILFLTAISLIWGSQFFFVDIIISKVPPVTLAAAKAFVGAITLTLIYFLFTKKGQRQPSSTYQNKKVRVLFVAGFPFLRCLSCLFILAALQLSGGFSAFRTPFTNHLKDHVLPLTILSIEFYNSLLFLK